MKRFIDIPVVLLLIVIVCSAANAENIDSEAEIQDLLIRMKDFYIGKNISLRDLKTAGRYNPHSWEAFKDLFLLVLHGVGEVIAAVTEAGECIVRVTEGIEMADYSLTIIESGEEISKLINEKKIETPNDNKNISDKTVVEIKKGVDDLNPTYKILDQGREWPEIVLKCIPGIGALRSTADWGNYDDYIDKRKFSLFKKLEKYPFIISLEDKVNNFADNSSRKKAYLAVLRQLKKRIADKQYLEGWQEQEMFKLIFSKKLKRDIYNFNEITNEMINESGIKGDKKTTLKLLKQLESNSYNNGENIYEIVIKPSDPAAADCQPTGNGGPIAKMNDKVSWWDSFCSFFDDLFFGTKRENKCQIQEVNKELLYFNFDSESVYRNFAHLGTEALIIELDDTQTDSPFLGGERTTLESKQYKFWNKMHKGTKKEYSADEKYEKFFNTLAIDYQNKIELVVNKEGRALDEDEGFSVLKNSKMSPEALEESKRVETTHCGIAEKSDSSEIDIHKFEESKKELNTAILRYLNNYPDYPSNFAQMKGFIKERKKELKKIKKEFNDSEKVNLIKPLMLFTKVKEAGIEIIITNKSDRPVEVHVDKVDGIQFESSSLFRYVPIEIGEKNSFMIYPVRGNSLEGKFLTLKVRVDDSELTKEIPFAHY